MQDADSDPVKTSSFKFAAVLATVLLLFAATSCREQKQVTSRGKSSLASKETEQPGELFKLRYRLKWLHQAQFAGSYMAREKGFYRKRGLDVEILPGGGDHPPYPSLMEGSCDIANLNLITALTYYDPARPIVNLSQISQKNSTLLVGKKTSGIRTIQDLRGKKIGVWRNEGGDHTRYFLERLDLNIRIIPFDWSVNLLVNDAIDMMSAMDYNEFHRILMSGLNEDELVIFDLAEHDYNLVDDGLYTTRSFYEQHPKQCRDFTAATFEGWNYALSHPEETLSVVLRYLRESHLPANPEHQAWMLAHMQKRILDGRNPAGYLHPADFNLANQILIERGLLTKPVDYRTFYPHGNAEKD